MQIDVGFGDIITPEPQLLSYPTILDLPAPKLQGYTIESVIAEKLETMIKRGISNSRMKDFFDVWAISRQFSFKSDVLNAAIRATFKQRGTLVGPFPECFSERFATHPEKNAQWNSFVHKNRLGLAPDTFVEVVSDIRQFLVPVLEEINEDRLASYS